MPFFDRQLMPLNSQWQRTSADSKTLFPFCFAPTQESRSGNDNDSGQGLALVYQLPVAGRSSRFGRDLHGCGVDGSGIADANT
jgi:hypothetical protein